MADASARVMGGDSERSIDSVNQWTRSQPWYQEQLARWGQRPDSVKLSKQQSAELVRLAQANGVQVDEGDIEIDPGGNFNPRGHKMRNTMIGLGIAGAVAAPFVAPALLGAGGGAAAAPTLGGGSTLAAGLGGASALPALAAPAVAGTVAGSVAATEAGIYGGAGLSGTPAAAASTGGKGLLSRVGSTLKGKAADLLGAGGRAISDATQAAGQNRMDAYDQSLRANSQYENQLMNRSADEQKQRGKALDDVYRASWYANRQASPNNTRGLTAISPEMQATLDALKVQGAEKLKSAAQYDSNGNPVLEKPTPSRPGLLERVGTYAGPAASGLSEVGKFMRGK